MLKSQKLDTFDKMERKAEQLSSEKADVKKGMDGANKEFRETIVDLYYKKIKKTSLNKTDIVSKAKDEAEFSKIKNANMMMNINDKLVASLKL